VLGSLRFQVDTRTAAVTYRLPYEKFICTQLPGIVLVLTNEYQSSMVAGGV